LDEMVSEEIDNTKKRREVYNLDIAPKYNNE
jgi:hypothetical protein